MVDLHAYSEMSRHSLAFPGKQKKNNLIVKITFVTILPAFWQVTPATGESSPS